MPLPRQQKAARRARRMTIGTALRIELSLDRRLGVTARARPSTVLLCYTDGMAPQEWLATTRTGDTKPPLLFAASGTDNTRTSPANSATGSRLQHAALSALPRKKE